MHAAERSPALVKTIQMLLLTWIAGICLVDVATAQALKLVETDQAIVVRHETQDILTYNKVSPPVPRGIDSVYQRSGCLHPINSPQGRTVTQMFPVDHPHQHGVFSAWVKTKYDGRAVDFWNLAGGTGRVLHERVVRLYREQDTVGFEVDLIHRATTKPAIDVLRERWKVTVYPTDGTYHYFDLESTQHALTEKPLIISKHHYGGMVLRGPTRWLTAKDRWVREHPDLEREPSQFVNDLGSDRVRGNHQHAKWVALTGSLGNKPATIAVLSHTDNFRSPQAARLHPTKPYFCFAPCVDGTFKIDRAHPFKARYRYLVTDAEPDAAWINQQWNAWCGK